MKNLLGDHQMTIQLFDGLDGIVKQLKGVRGLSAGKGAIWSIGPSWH